MLYLFLMLAVLSSFACGKKKKMKKVADAGYVWMQYDETKCENPWQFNWLMAPTEEQVSAAVRSHLEARCVNVNSH